MSGGGTRTWGVLQQRFERFAGGACGNEYFGWILPMQRMKSKNSSTPADLGKMGFNVFVDRQLAMGRDCCSGKDKLNISFMDLENRFSMEGRDTPRSLL
jgi:hypothetical protein